jgi:hypothetical protein
MDKSVLSHEAIAAIWWELANEGAVSWRSVTAWCFGAAEATDSEDWRLLHEQADARWDAE